MIAIAIQQGWPHFVFPVENIIVNSAEVYLHKSQLEKCTRLFHTMITNKPNYLLQITKNAYSKFDSEKSKLLKLEIKDFKKFSDKQLVATFKTWFDWLNKWTIAYLAPANLAEGFLTLELQKEIGRYVDPVKDFNRFQQLSLLFSTSARRGFLEQYEAELHRLSRLSKNIDEKTEKLSKSLEKKIAFLEHEYGWLGDTGRLDNFWSANEIKKQILDQKNGEETLENDQLVIEALNDMGADRRLKNTVKMVREYIHFRTFRIDVFVIFSYRARFLFEEIARRLGIPFENFTHMSANEVVSALQEGRLPNDLNQRKEGFAVVLRSEGTEILTGKNAKELADKIKGPAQVSVNELRGTTACVGQAKGIARLVFTKADVEKMQEGDVLISSMTKPELVPAMKRASAIITDEGGITCHAAIVSRELKIPCVIGIKIATRVLKDGDLVEVDADKGTVKIIKRAGK